eukprot:UN23809
MEVWDWDRLTDDDWMGNLQFCLKDLMPQQRINKKIFPLQNVRKKGKLVQKGSLELTINFEYLREKTSRIDLREHFNSITKESKNQLTMELFNTFLQKVLCIAYAPKDLEEIFCFWTKKTGSIDFETFYTNLSRLSIP